MKFNIQDFGGIIKLGRVQFEGPESEFADFVNSDELIPSDKFTYSVRGNIDDQIFIDKFKSEKRKAVIRRGTRSLTFQSGNTEQMAKADFQIFAYQRGRKIYYGLSEQIYTPKEVKERDIKKPVRREQLAISPRLAKIIVNLSQVQPGQLMLDPFCGVGGVIQEALIQGINCYGIDKDKLAVEQARQNIKWLSNQYKIEASYNLLAADAKAVSKIRFDAVATEPALGELFRHKPRDFEARQIIDRFEKLMIPILKNLKRLAKPGAKIVFIAPFVREFSIDIRRVCSQTSLRQYSFDRVAFPIKEFREGQFISREIFVLE
jgi:tRNA G10  N-methylase Trm11